MNSLPCPPALWPRFSALLDAAMELSGPDRAAWLDALAGEDAAIRPLLERVLGSEAYATTGQFLTTPDLGLTASGFSAGERLGPYRLEALLGEGGMGEVWRASRHDDGPQRLVALKLPYPELLAGPYRQRFARERDMLAALCHPHIAQLYDAGTSAEGHPYLAIELVWGQPITEACHTTGATLERRIDLVVQILESLAYAHQRLIVHRDIKPSNVLVTPEGDVKLLDFGIATMLTPSSPDEALRTQPQARLATPGYAAPEQMQGEAITVATDLFSVGILLFELCTGHRPFLRVPSEPDAAPARLASAGAQDKNIAKRLRGDLDAVIAKAITLAPIARYPSADAFAADLRRWRGGLPVRARRVGWASRTRKFVRRNTLGVGLAAVVALSLIGGTAGIAWQARRAEAQAARAGAIKDYLLNLFAEGDPRSGQSIVTMTAKSLLDLGADRAPAAFAHDLQTEFELQQTLGNIYDTLSDGPRSEAAWTRRLAVGKRLYGPLDPRVIDASLALVSSLVIYQDEEQAKTLLNAIKAPLSSLYGKDSLPWAQWLSARAKALRTTHGGRDEAIADDIAAIAIFERLAPDNTRYAETVSDLSDYQYDAEDCDASLASMQKAQKLMQAAHNYDPMDELSYRDSVASRLGCLGRMKEADDTLALAEAQAERQLGRQSMWYLHAATTRATFANLIGDRARANAIFQSLLTHDLHTAAATGFPTSVRRAYGAALARDGRAAAAVPILETVLTETRRHAHDEPNIRRTEYLLGDAYDQSGRTADARPLLKLARDEYLRDGAPGMPNTLAAQERWGRFLLDHGDTEGAAAEFKAALQSARIPCAQQALAASGLARIALAEGNTVEADAQSAHALRILAATTTLYDVRIRIDIWLARARCTDGTTARALRGQAVAAALAYDAPESAQLARARE